ncbi:MAG: ABC transporter ATP-binding protein [Deltaproteobacteria bacterium]|nr:ABC transporter ATP-binding protein [Deltaproteobacteria bacterium]
MDAIVTQGLQFSYDKKNRPVLANINLNISRGTITAVLGPNGAGKTTLLYILLGLLSPESGQIYIFEKPMIQYPRKDLKRLIGMVAQSESIPFDLNLMEYVLLGRAPYLRLLSLPDKKDTAIAEAAITKIGLGYMKYRAVPSLSSGERQLTAIARSLTQSPDILLLDEPTSHLDLLNSRKILKLMKTISQDEGRTIIFTTHDPNAAVSIADHVVLLGKNGVVAGGAVESVLTEDNLAATYGEPVEVVHTDKGMFVVAL